MKRPQLALWTSIAAVITLVFWLVFFALPPLAVPSDVGNTRAERTKLRNDFRSTETQFLGGLALAAGLIFTWRTLRLNREGQLTDRFSKAIDQLGNGKLDVRLGGIYALERIARDSERDHGPVVDVLTAYVRRYVRTKDDPPDGAAYDVQAILTVLGRRTREHDKNIVDLEGADLRFATVTGTFRNARFRGADLSGAEVIEADLTGTDLDRLRALDTKFFASSLRQASIDGADFTGALFQAGTDTSETRPPLRVD